MSRGYDGYEIDDSRNSDFRSGRSGGRGASSSVDAEMRLQSVHREAKEADWLDRQQQERGARDPPPQGREERLEEILAQRVRSAYVDRDKIYSLRDSEIHALSEVGKFRVVATQDLAELAYNGDHSRMDSDIENLRRQGLVKETELADMAHKPTPVVSLTKEGRKLLSRGKVVLPLRERIGAGLQLDFLKSYERGALCGFPSVSRESAVAALEEAKHLSLARP
jgi:hypothetical protein